MKLQYSNLRSLPPSTKLCTSTGRYGCAPFACNNLQTCWRVFPQAPFISAVLRCLLYVQERIHALSSASLETRSRSCSSAFESWCDTAGISETSKCSSYSSVCWMSIHRETFPINRRSRSNTVLAFSINYYHLGILWRSQHLHYCVAPLLSRTCGCGFAILICIIPICMRVIAERWSFTFRCHLSSSSWPFFHFQCVDFTQFAAFNLHNVI